MSMGNSGNSTTTTSNAEVSNLLVQGFKTAKEGRRDEAYEIFCDVVRRDPSNELGWLYRAATTEDLSEAYVCLQRVLSLNPNNEKAQRGVERIQNRLAAESNRSNATAAGAAAAGGAATPPAPTSPSLDEKDVISGFNPGFDRPPVAPVPEPTSQPTARYAYQQAQSPFNPVPASESAEGAVAPYRPDFGQLNARYQPGGPSADGGYSPNNRPDEDYEEDEEDEGMVDEPVMTPSGRIGSQRELTNSRRAGLVGGLAAARQRGRAAFGSETPTDLDVQGRRRSQRILIPLVIVGVVLVLVALGLLLFGPKNNTGNQQAIVATNTAGNATSAATTAAQATTANAAITVPVVGNTTTAATTAAASTTAAATSAAVATTAQAAATTAKAATTAATTAAAVTTAPPATTAAPPAATTAAPPPATTAPAPPAQPRAIVYTIKSGDNLTRLATQYSTSIPAIVAANPSLAANNNNIFAGARIIIPVSRPDFRGKGAILGNNETLQTIADRYKVSVDDLARLNGFASPADAKPGDAILVP